MADLDNQITQSMGSEAQGGASRGSRLLARASRALTNASKKAVRTANKVAKKITGKSLKQLWMLLPLPAKIAIIAVILVFCMTVLVYNYNADGITNYEDAHKGYEQTGSSIVQQEPVQIEQDDDADTTDDTDNSEVLYPDFNHSDFYDTGEETVSGKDTSELEYEGEDVLTSEIGLLCNDYIAFYQDLFDYVFNILCQNEIDKMIVEQNYNVDATRDSYKDQESPFKDYINYAELICVMSQNPLLSYEDATMAEIQEFLNESETNLRLQNLFSVYAEEKIGYKEIYSSVDSVSEPTDSTSFSSRVGEVVEDTSFFNTYASSSQFSLILNAFTSDNKFNLLTFRQYCKDHEDEVYEDKGQGFVTNGRTVIQKTNEKPKFRIRKVITSQRVEEETSHEYKTVTNEEFYDNYASSYGYEASTGRLIDTHRGGYVTESSNSYVLVTTYKTEVIWEYLYADVQILPYCLYDLFQCFEVDADEYNVSHPTVTNFNVLEEQEVALRWRASDIDFGKEERTTAYTPYEALINGITSDEVSAIQKSLKTQLILCDDWQTNIINSCTSLNGIKYGISAKGYHSFVCCTYVYEAFAQIGMYICPTVLPKEDTDKLGSYSVNRNLFYSCTLMAYYFRNYQPQACIYSSSVNDWEVGDIVFMQYAINKSDMKYNASAISKTNNNGNGEYSDHVYIYVGDGLIAEQTGGSINRSLTRKLTEDYRRHTWFVVRPSLLN